MRRRGQKLALLVAVAVFAFAAAGCGSHANPAKLTPENDNQNPYGAPYRSMGRGIHAVYFSTEKGRRVLCYVTGWQTTDATMSCDWDGYHALYGPGDPADQK
jgi:hypothetical protein